MAELTENEIQRIKQSLESFSRASNNISKTLDADYQRRLSSARSNLSSYSTAEESAVKEANKEISNVWDSSRRSNSINDIIQQQGENSKIERDNRLKQYDSELESIIGSLPVVGDL